MNNQIKPLISIIIPTYNHANYLGKALNSILDQSYNNWEVIVIDNHSTDKTVNVINRFNDKRIRYIKIHNNGIIAKSRNKGILLSKGEWIAFLDSDDWWSLNKLKICVEHINSDVDLIYHDLEIISNERLPFKRKTVRSRHLKKPVLIDLLVGGNAISNSSVIVRKNILEKVGLINEKKELIAAEDYNTWLKIAAVSDKFLYLSKRLGYYFVHDRSVSKKNMALSIQQATSEFLSILNDKQKIKLESNTRYISGRFYYLNHDYKKAKKDLLFTLCHGLFSLKLKALFMILVIILK